MGIKSEDSEAEAILRRVVEAYKTTGTLADVTKRIDAAMNEARWYIGRKDACEFVEDWGAGCARAAVRVSFGIPCCEGHAKIRDRSLV